MGFTGILCYPVRSYPVRALFLPVWKFWESWFIKAVTFEIRFYCLVIWLFIWVDLLFCCLCYKASCLPQLEGKMWRSSDILFLFSSTLSSDVLNLICKSHMIFLPLFISFTRGIFFFNLCKVIPRKGGINFFFRT